MKHVCAAILAAYAALGAVALPSVSVAQDQSGGTPGAMMGQDMMATGLMMPQMDAAEGRRLFAAKGCVVCHSINGVGGEDAPRLDASTMKSPMNPFSFAAKMWDGAEAMVAMQRDELGEPIRLTGAELADIVAFVHDPEAQKALSEDDIPPRIKELMDEDD